MNSIYAPKYDNLYACSLTPEFHARTCNYWYTVTNGATAHTAFTTRAGLDKWMAERNLRLVNPLPEIQGEYGTTRIEGSYITRAHMSYDEFYNLPNVVLESRTLSNGDYVLARFTEDEHGVRTEHTLNPNCRYRHVFDYRESSEMMK